MTTTSAVATRAHEFMVLATVADTHGLPLPPHVTVSLNNMGETEAQAELTEFADRLTAGCVSFTEVHEPGKDAIVVRFGPPGHLIYTLFFMRNGGM